MPINAGGIEAFEPEHLISKRVNIARRCRNNPCLIVGGQAVAEHGAQLVEQVTDVDGAASHTAADLARARCGGKRMVGA